VSSVLRGHHLRMLGRAAEISAGVVRRRMIVRDDDIDLPATKASHLDQVDIDAGRVLNHSAEASPARPRIMGVVFSSHHTDPFGVLMYCTACAGPE
jgi:hypothetical protein